MDLLRPPAVWMLVLFLALGKYCSGHGSFVKVGEGLKVKRGQWAYLQQEHLRFLLPQQKNMCKLEVVLNEPISQRVGTVVPQVFDCSFMSEEVKYVHNGCPLLKEDVVLLRLYRFTETETLTEDVSLHVDVLEPDCSIIRMGPGVLSVPHFYGLSNAVDRDVVSFHYERKSSLECSIQLTPHHTPFPTHGRLVTGEPQTVPKRGDEPENVNYLRQQLECPPSAECLKVVSCDDFLLMGLRYRHTEPPSPDIDYIPIRLTLTDTKSGSTYQAEDAWIPVQVVGAMPNQAPRPSFSSMYILEVDQFILTPLSTATLDAEDEENPKELLVFNITKAPVDGFITHLWDHTHPVTSFTWTDLNDMLIGYQPPNSSQLHRHNFEAELEAHDLFFEKSSAITMHLSVRSSDTNAPRVSWNMGLSLLEGQSRPITWEQLQIVDNDNLNAVRILVVDGLKHGRLTVKEEKSFLFTVKDIRAGVVLYHHDDSDSTKDFIVFRITDGRHQTRHKFPIKILPKDDSPPFLITNMLLEVSEGHMVLLRGSTLQASDMDSSDDYIMFNITSPPKAGDLMKVPGPGLMGYPVVQFLQRDLSQSKIYYQHHLDKALDDSFELVLSDFHDPPNLSEPQVVMVHIEPVPDQPPKEVSGSSRCITVKETEVVHITRKHLHFLDQHSLDSELTYTITSPPFFPTQNRSSSPDAGRLFLVDSIPTFTKDPTAPVLRLFTQHAVNFMKVAYMPPIMDIGPYPIEIHFVLSVANQRGQTVTGICFNLTVLPVDNQPPQVITNPLFVDEGQEAWIDSHHLLLSDMDSVEEDLRVQLRKHPQHGAMWLGGLTLRSGQNFTIQHLMSPNLRYIHDGSESTEDGVELTATDGTNAVTFILPVQVVPVNDEVPVLVAGLKPVLTCSEGHEVQISADYISATDADSENNTLGFLIARQPTQGKVLRSGVEVDRFVQRDVTAGRISYQHSGEEIGLRPSYDTITFVISDEETICCNQKTPTRTRDAVHLRSNLPVYDLQISVLPVNNQSPLLAAGDIFKVAEGGSASITTSYLKAVDSDSELEDLLISVVSPPQFGFIENVLPTPGFEKSNSGRSITSFSYKNVQEGNINYVQSRHRQMEPTADQFMLQVSDGRHTSAHLPFFIIITPTNDEPPEFTAANITVREGETVKLDASWFSVIDLDVPKDVLLFSVTHPPQHGTIAAHREGGAIARREETRAPPAGLDFTMTDLNNGLDVTFTHDDSEVMADAFTLRLTDGRHVLHRHVGVAVRPVNDEEPYVVRNHGLEVEPGEVRLVSSLKLVARDGDTPPSHLLYMFESVPNQGLLQLKDAQGWQTVTAGTNCSQDSVDMNHLRYVHTDRETTQKKDFFIFHLEDGTNQSPSQYFQIRIKDMEKGNVAVFVSPASVSRGDRLVLCSGILLATDGTDKAEELVYVVTKAPINGHIENVRRPGLMVSTFTQMDVAANLVSYVHDKRASSSSESFRFVVGNGKSSRQGVVEIQIETSDRVLPSLSVNKGLTVPRGSSAILGPDYLALSDPDTPPSLMTFVILKLPQYGRLLLAGTILTSDSEFTQREIQDQLVMYKHDGGLSQIDRFYFTASDGTNQGFLLDGLLQTEPVLFTLQIVPLDAFPPEVVKLRPLWEVESIPGGRHGIFVSSQQLKAADGHGRDEELQFCVVRPPLFGYLENLSSGDFVSRCFSQVELTRRTIVYVIDVEGESLSDSLTFTVSDPMGNTGTSHRLDFHWSSVQLSQPAWSTCEDQGPVSLELLRKGNLASISFITIKVTERSATAGADFLLNGASLVQFDPGVKERTWTIEVLKDVLEEDEETLEVQLVSPQGTLIGPTGRALITIHDWRTGQCQMGHPQERDDSVLGGREVWDKKYPQHGSIRLEKLPIGQASSGTAGGLRVLSPQRSIAPSSVYNNGTDTIYTYHGILPVRVGDGESQSRSWRKTNLQVVNQTPTFTLPKQDHNQEPVRHVMDVPRTCGPELNGLVHFNQTINQLFYCNGVSWKPWKTKINQLVEGNECPDGWRFHRERCYILRTEEKLPWSSAQKACRERYKGTLASVLSEDHMDWLWNFSGRKPFWIGLSDREGRGHWEWSDGQLVGYTNWKKFLPGLRTQDQKQGCVLVWKRAKWLMRDCKKSRGHGFICSLEPGTTSRTSNHPH